MAKAPKPRAEHIPTVQERRKSGLAYLRENTGGPSCHIVYDAYKKEYTITRDAGGAYREFDSTDLMKHRLIKDELLDTFNKGEGCCDNLPEPRVLHAVCELLDLDYIEAMKAFGHITKWDTTPPCSITQTLELTVDDELQKCMDALLKAIDEFGSRLTQVEAKMDTLLARLAFASCADEK